MSQLSDSHWYKWCNRTGLDVGPNDAYWQMKITQWKHEKKLRQEAIEFFGDQWVSENCRRWP